MTACILEIQMHEDGKITLGGVEEAVLWSKRHKGYLDILFKSLVGPYELKFIVGHPGIADAKPR